MQQIYNSDKPIDLKEQDRFNRYKFSNRIADTIIKRNTDDGLVIGLYGIWGEGKSSVLNMIEEDLCKSENIIIVKFNPWRFKDEDALILNYLKNLSIALERELNNKKEKLGKFLSKYGSLASVIGLDLSKIGKSLSDSEIENLKERVNDFLKESSKKIVVIIDDIDRLDKQELFALFKLIKLTGDFTNTYYILSFDDEMVASAIGDRYAGGTKDAGYNFLEKIIQVPLRIPQAFSRDLLNYLFELINKVLDTNGIDLRGEDLTVGYQISQNLSLRIKTPRLAIRYANSLSFLVPLLKGEVNIADLILLEGIKLFYSQHYNLIKQSPEYFIASYQNVFSETKDKNKIEELKLNLEELNKGLAKNEAKAILALLKHLFPKTKEILENYMPNDRNWAKEKRISSSKYFDRYFLYSVPNNDISDVYFDEYINTIEQKSFDEIENEISEILSKIDPTEFLNKIGFFEDDLNWEQRKIIATIICKCQDKFEGIKGGTFMVGFFNPKAQAAIRVKYIIAKHKDKKESLEFIKNLIRSDLNFDFLFELVSWFAVDKNKEDKVYQREDVKCLEEILLERALKECQKNSTNIFQRYSNRIFRLLEFWHQKSPQQLKKYIDKCMKEHEDFQEVIIEELTSTIYSSSSPEPYKTDFTKAAYEALKKYYDVIKLYKTFQKKKYKEIRNTEVKFFETDGGQTKETSIRQFIHWYDLDVNINNEQAIEDAELVE